MVKNIDDLQLQQIVASVIIDCNKEAFNDIHEAFEKIMSVMLNMIDKIGVEYDLKDIEHAVIDSIAAGLKLLIIGKRDL